MEILSLKGRSLLQLFVPYGTANFLGWRLLWVGVVWSRACVCERMRAECLGLLASWADVYGVFDEAAELFFGDDVAGALAGGGVLHHFVMDLEARPLDDAIVVGALLPDLALL